MGPTPAGAAAVLSGSFVAAVAASLNRNRVTLRVVPGGASNLAFQVFENETDAVPIAFMRCKTDPSLKSLGYSLKREAALMQHAERLGLPVARVLAVFDDPDSMLMEVVDGTSRPNAAEIEIVGPKYMALVARLHRADAADFLVERHATMTDALMADLDAWVSIGDRNGILDEPLLALAVRVLRDRMPAPHHTPVLVHGDIGPGNFMCSGGEVTAMLDWELAHLGDPHEDLAWLWMRGAHTDFGDPQQRIAEYQAASGAAVDRSRLDWHLAFVMFKSMVALHSRLRAPVPGEVSYLQSVVRLTYDALLAARLAHLLERPSVLLAQTPTRVACLEANLADELLAGRDLSRLEVRVIEYLRNSAAQSAWERAGLDADAAKLGVEPTRLTEQVRNCSATDLADLVEVVARHADRRACAMPPALRMIEQAQRIDLW